MKELLANAFPSFSEQTLTMLDQTLGMFAYLAVELTILFLAISYLVGVLQMFITPERVRQTMSSQNGRGYIIAALLGAITPFLLLLNHSIFERFAAGAGRFWTAAGVFIRQPSA